jgi:phosphatidylserine/phosphatidylglycerophosphate/cardiolipin synthase-like enzyme
MNDISNTELHTAWALPLVADIDAAQVSLLFTSLSLHPPRKMDDKPIARLWQAIEDAARRKVQIDFVLPQTSKSHPATAFNSSAAARLHACGAHPHAAPPARLLHAKTAIIDGSIVWVGSGNWTAAATAHNHEAYLRVCSPHLAAQLRNNWIKAGFIGA